MESKGMCKIKEDTAHIARVITLCVHAQLPQHCALQMCCCVSAETQQNAKRWNAEEAFKENAVITRPAQSGTVFDYLN